MIQENYLSSDFKKASKQKDYPLDFQSYSQWAAKEIIKRISECPNDPPLIVIEEFRNEIHKYFEGEGNNDYIFLVACKIADEIVDLLTMY